MTRASSTKWCCWLPALGCPRLRLLGRNRLPPNPTPTSTLAQPAPSTIRLTAAPMKARMILPITTPIRTAMATATRLYFVVTPIIASGRWAAWAPRETIVHHGMGFHSIQVSPISTVAVLATAWVWALPAAT